MTWRFSDLAPAISTLMVLGALWYAAVVDQPVRLAVEGPRIQFEPGYVRLRVTIEQDARNRELWVGLWAAGWDDPTVSSRNDLPGKNAARTRWITYKDVPAGDYTAFAVVYRMDGTRDEARDHVEVRSRF